MPPKWIWATLARFHQTAESTEPSQYVLGLVPLGDCCWNWKNGVFYDRIESGSIWKKNFFKCSSLNEQYWPFKRFFAIVWMFDCEKWFGTRFASIHSNVELNVFFVFNIERRVSNNQLWMMESTHIPVAQCRLIVNQTFLTLASFHWIPSRYSSLICGHIGGISSARDAYSTQFIWMATLKTMLAIQIDFPCNSIWANWKRRTLHVAIRMLLLSSSSGLGNSCAFVCCSTFVFLACLS